MPAFALNTVKIDDKVEARTEHFDKKEFIAKNIELNSDARGGNLSFEAISNPDKLVSCKIHQIEPSGAERLLEDFILTESFETYLLDLKPAINTQLKLSFYTDNVLRYSILLEDENSTNKFEVFPTLSQTYVNINLYAEPINASYLVSSLNGQVMLNGKLNKLLTKLDVSSLQPGTYIVSVELAGSSLKSKKFVKH